jgi:hypothetical protein
MAVAVGGCALLTLGGCHIDWGGGGDPPTTADVTVQYVLDAATAPKCTSNSVYRYTPVTLTGNDGSTTEITHTVAQQVFATGTGNGECLFTDSAFGLKLGRWKIGELRTAICDVTLHAGTNIVTIRSRVCSTTL